MGRDPAILFYPQDFLVGVEFFTNEEIGAYIKTLCHQADKWSLTEKQIKVIAGNNSVFNAIIEKFKQDEDGKFYNEKMREVQLKRKEYSEKQSKRIQDYWDKKKSNTVELPRNNNGSTVVVPVENGNGNGNGNEDKDIIESVIEDKKENKKSLDYLDSNIDNFRIDEFEDIDIDKEYKKFRDWLKSKGKTYKDYSAGFRNWLRSEFTPQKQVVKYGID